MQVFEDRDDAGRKLAEALADHPRVQRARDGSDEAVRIVVLGVPRGGIPVGAEVARALGAEFDVVIVRKLRSPANPELGFGAVGADGHVEVDEATVARLGMTDEQVREEVEDRTGAVQRRISLYRGVAPAVDLRGAGVVVVDDGIATGGTARLACAYARRNGAAWVVLAAPVAPRGAAERFSDAADDVLVLSTPAEFIAVGQAYNDFAELTDDDAVAALQRATARA